jgi:hypothetical protein
LAIKPGPQALSIVQQAIGIQAMWSGAAKLGPNRLLWIGELRPSAVSPTYKVQLAYRTHDVPRVHVLEPKLDTGHRERLPHVYTGDRLCLYTPGEWNRSMSLAKTVIPWAAEWLFHYELWKVTDEWSGGGHVYAPDDWDD